MISFSKDRIQNMWGNDYVISLPLVYFASQHFARDGWIGVVKM